MTQYFTLLSDQTSNSKSTNPEFISQNCLLLSAKNVFLLEKQKEQFVASISIKDSFS